MSNVASNRWASPWNELNLATTTLVAAICLRVASVPTPSHWHYVLIPMLLLTTLTLTLAQSETAHPPAALQWVGIACCSYIVSVIAFGSLSQLHWADQSVLAAFCLVTALVGQRVSANAHLARELLAQDS